MLTEFDCEYARGLDRIQEVMQLCDLHLVPWVGWQFKEFINITGSPPSGTLFDPKTGETRQAMMKLFARPYPSSISGKMKEFKFDFEKSHFTFSFTPSSGPDDDGVEGITTIAVNEEPAVGYGKWIVEITADSNQVITDIVRVERLERKVLIIVGKGWKGGLLNVRLSLEAEAM